MPVDMPNPSVELRHDVTELPLVRRGRKTSFKVLILDDDNFDCARIQRICQQSGLAISTTVTSDIPEFSEALGKDIFDLIFIDYTLQKGNGLVAQRLVQQHPFCHDTGVVLMSSNLQTEIAVESMKLGSLDCLDKEALTPERLREVMTVAANTLYNRTKDWVDEKLEQQRAHMTREIACVVQEELSRGDLINSIDTCIRRVLAENGIPTLASLDLSGDYHSDEPFKFR